jgi:nucleoside phosphorylase
MATPTLTFFGFVLYEDRRLEELNQEALRFLERLTGKRKRGDVLTSHTQPGASGYRGPNDWSPRLLLPSPAGLTWHRQQALGKWDWLVASLECHSTLDRWDSWLEREARRLLSQVHGAVATARVAYIDYSSDADLDDVLGACHDRLRDILSTGGPVAPGVVRGVDQWWIVLAREDDSDMERWLLSADMGCLPRALAGHGALLLLSDKLTKRAHWLEEVAGGAPRPAGDLSANAVDLSRLSRGIAPAYEAAAALEHPPAGWPAEVDALRERAAAAARRAVEAQRSLTPASAPTLGRHAHEPAGSTSTAHLQDLLRDLFSSSSDLRDFLRRLPHGKHITDAVSDRVGLAQAAAEAVDALQRRGIVDAGFFEALAKSRPSRQQEVAAVATAFGITIGITISQVPTQPLPPPPSPQPRPGHSQASASLGPSGIDVGILIALREEFDNFLELLPVGYRSERDLEHGGYYYLVDAGPSDRPYRCVVRLVGDMGPGIAGMATDRLISRWHPAVVANVGIAASLHGDLMLGDVAVAEQVDTYAANLKAVDDGSGGWEFEHRGRVYHADHAMLEEVRHLRYAQTGVYGPWTSASRADVEVLLGTLGKRQRAGITKAALIRAAATCSAVHLASGPVVSAAAAFNRWLRGRDGTVKALEMEAAGFAEAAVRRAVPVPTLVVRGISDLGDERKSKLDAIGGGAFRRIAMRNATRLLFALLDAELIPRGTYAPASPEPPVSRGPTPSPTRSGGHVAGIPVGVRVTNKGDLVGALPARWMAAVEDALRVAGLTLDLENCGHAVTTAVDIDEMGSQRITFNLDSGPVQDLPVLSLEDAARRVADAVIERVIAVRVERGEPVVVRVVNWPREHACPYQTTFRLEAPSAAGAASSGERWLAAPLERIATVLSRVSPAAPIILVPQCTPGAAIRAGAVLKRVAGQRASAIWQAQEWSLDDGADVDGELIQALDGRGFDARDHLCLLVSISQPVREAWVRWAEVPNRVALRELHVQPASGPSQDVLKSPEQAVGWARRIGQLLKENRPPVHSATSIFAATPGPLAVALGRELNAVGRMILMDFDKDQQQYVAAFEFTT